MPWLKKHTIVSLSNAWFSFLISALIFSASTVWMRRAVCSESWTRNSPTTLYKLCRWKKNLNENFSYRMLHFKCNFSSFATKHENCVFYDNCKMIIAKVKKMSIKRHIKRHFKLTDSAAFIYSSSVLRQYFTAPTNLRGWSLNIFCRWSFQKKTHKLILALVRCACMFKLHSLICLHDQNECV